MPFLSATRRLPRTMRTSVLSLMLVLAVVACSGPGADSRPTALPTSPSLSATEKAIAESTPLIPTATQAPTATATAQPTATVQPSPTVLQPTATVPPSPIARSRPGGQNVDLPDVDAHYTLDIVSLDLASGAVQVKQQVDVRSKQGHLPHIFFSVATANYGYFTLDDARVNGVAVTPERRNDGVTLAIPLPDGDRWTVEFGFRLNLQQVPQDWNGTGRDGSIIRLGYWFPILSTDFPFPATADPGYTRVSSFDVWLPLPPNTPFVSTGTEASQETLSDGRTRHHLTADRVRDFAIVVTSDFRLDTATTQSNVRVELLSPTTMSAAKRAEALDAAVLTLERLSVLIGPYPYPAFRIVHAGSSLPGGIEFPMLVFLNMDVGRLDRLVYHETAHQWMYGLIGTRPQQDPWIDEGGAQFLEGGLDSGFQTKPSPPDGGFKYPLDSSDAELPSGPGIPGYDAVYLQGQLFYLTVLQTMGEARFWAAMQEIYQNNVYGIVTPWDVLTIWQKHSTVDLRPLFSQTFRYPWVKELPPPGG